MFVLFDSSIFFLLRSEHPLAQLYCHSIMEHHHFDQCLMILNSPVSATFLCMLKETILISIFGFWTESHPYMFLSALYSFLGKESKCSNIEITALLLSATKAFQVLPDKGSLADILLSTCFLGPKETKGFAAILMTSYEPPNKPQSFLSFQKTFKPTYTQSSPDETKPNTAHVDIPK